MKKRLARKVYRGVVREWERAGMALTALLHTGRWRGDTFRRAASRLGVGLVVFFSMVQVASAEYCVIRALPSYCGVSEPVQCAGWVNQPSLQACEEYGASQPWGYVPLEVAWADVTSRFDEPFVPDMFCGGGGSGSTVGQCVLSGGHPAGFTAYQDWQVAAFVEPLLVTGGVFGVDSAGAIADMFAVGVLLAALAVLWLAYRSVRRSMLARA